MTDLTSSEIKIIRYINRNPDCTYTQIYKKFPYFKECYYRLETNHFIKSTDPNDNLVGNEYEDSNNPTTIQIDRNGSMYLESLKWFNWQFIVKELLCPAIVSIIVSLITTLITLAVAG